MFCRFNTVERGYFCGEMRALVWWGWKSAKNDENVSILQSLEVERLFSSQLWHQSLFLGHSSIIWNIFARQRQFRRHIRHGRSYPARHQWRVKCYQMKFSTPTWSKVQSICNKFCRTFLICSMSATAGFSNATVRLSSTYIYTYDLRTAQAGIESKQPAQNLSNIAHESVRKCSAQCRQRRNFKMRI